MDWLPEDHLAYQVDDLVGELDLRPLLSGYSSDGRGAPAYSPALMVSLLLYGWMRHIYSSRKIAALCREDVGGRVIAGGCLPDHRSINTFRLRHAAALKGLFGQSVSLCQRAGMVSLTHVCLDGSKIAANASKRKAMSYDRMVTEEARLASEIEGYFRRAAEEDAAEDAEYGSDQEGPAVSEELRRRRSRLVKIREAKAALEAEARAAVEAKEASAAQSGPKPRGRKPEVPSGREASPKPKAQRCFTDPESRIMKGASGAYLQAYNAQMAVDGDHQVIVACDLSQQATDVGHLPDLVGRVADATGFKPQTVLADPGYFSAENVRKLADAGIEALIPPDRERCGTPDSPAVPLSEEELAQRTPVEQMRHRVSTQAGRDAYRRRKAIIEPTYGQIKGSAGSPGFLGFLRRGLGRCTTDWYCLCARHNFLKYIRFRMAQAGRHPQKAPGVTMPKQQGKQRNPGQAGRIEARFTLI
jgi:transposase